jgi:hypothetical protein
LLSIPFPAHPFFLSLSVSMTMTAACAFQAVAGQATQPIRKCLYAIRPVSPTLSLSAYFLVDCVATMRLRTPQASRDAPYFVCSCLFN